MIVKILTNDLHLFFVAGGAFLKTNIITTDEIRSFKKFACKAVLLLRVGFLMRAKVSITKHEISC